MLSHVLKRLLYMIPTLLIISVISFTIIQLPPGDYLSAYIMSLKKQGQLVDESTIASLEKRYGLDQPIYTQYFMWMSGVVRGDFGQSFDWNKPVSDLIWGWLLLTSFWRWY